MAMQILQANEGSTGRDFWVQPDSISNLRNGLIVAEVLLTPGGLISFLRPGCPLDLSLSSFDERALSISIVGTQVAVTGRDLRTAHGKGRNAGFISSTTMEETLTHINNLNI